MGTFLVECVEGCSCEPATESGHWEAKESQMQLRQMVMTPSGGLAAVHVVGHVGLDISGRSEWLTVPGLAVESRTCQSPARRCLPREPANPQR